MTRTSPRVIRLLLTVPKGLDTVTFESKQIGAVLIDSLVEKVEVAEGDAETHDDEVAVLVRLYLVEPRTAGVGSLGQIGGCRSRSGDRCGRSRIDVLVTGGRDAELVALHLFNVVAPGVEDQIPGLELDVGDVGALCDAMAGGVGRHRDDIALVLEAQRPRGWELVAPCRKAVVHEEPCGADSLFQGNRVACVTGLDGVCRSPA